MDIHCAFDCTPEDDFSTLVYALIVYAVKGPIHLTLTVWENGTYLNNLFVFILSRFEKNTHFLQPLRCCSDNENIYIIFLVK